MAPRIPPEITDVIIGSIPHNWWDGSSTLRNCALVCSDWLPASRHCLLHDVVIADVVSYDIFVERVLHSNRMQPWLASTTRLAILPHDYVPDRELSQRPIIQDLAGRLPNLTILTICVDWVESHPHRSTHMALSQFTSLRKLNLSYCAFPSFHLIRRLICGLPGLNELEVYYTRWRPIPPERPRMPVFASRRLPALITLSVEFADDEECVAELLEWLFGTPTRGSLQSLHYLPFVIQKASHNHLLQMVAPNLTDLWIFDAMTDGPGKILLPPFVQLKKLRISYYFAVPQTHGSQAAIWARTSLLLEELPSQLAVLYLDVDLYSDRNTMVSYGPEARLDFEGIEVLDTVLERPNYKDLQILSFILIVRGGDDITEAQYRERFRQKLPKLHARRPRAIEVSFRHLLM
ncbi:hypothetical protein C8Q76DRAFT_793193 [Earliella scabrosa]|nr:hypothetical protein C8Q76DRAFT_793193 [Earliella scabrosa]